VKNFFSCTLAILLVITVIAGLACNESSQAETDSPYRWRNVEIGGTGFVTGIIYHPKAPNVAYVRTDIGGAYRWNPATQRWVPLEDWVGPDDWSLLGVESLALDPRDARRVYLAAGMYTNHWVGNGAILRSVDQGRTWEKVPVPFKFGGNEDGRYIGERLAVDPNLGSRLLLGTRHNGLWKSEDFGGSWHQVSAFPVTGSEEGAGIGFVIFDGSSGIPGHPSRTIYIGVATTRTNLYRSTNGGATWEALPGQPRGLMPHRGVLTPDGALYLSYGDKPGPNGVAAGAVWKLDTASGKWTDITPVEPGAGGEDKFGYAGLAVDARDSRTVVVSTIDRWARGDDIYRTTDGGRTWKDLATDATHDASATPYVTWGRSTLGFGHWIGDIEINPFNSEQALYTTGEGLWGTDNLRDADRGLSTRWKVWAQGIEETAVTTLLSPPSGPPLISGVLDVGGFRHDDLSVSPQSGIWTNPTMTSVTGLDFAQANPDFVVRVGSSSQARGAFSTDGAKSWQPFASEPNKGAGANDSSRSIAVAADGGAFVWSAPDGWAYVSRDRGGAWHRCKGLGANLAVISDRVNPKDFYAMDPDQHRLLVSNDGAESFQENNRNLPAQAAQLRAAPSRQGYLWLTAADNGLWRSQDGGAHFCKIGKVQTAETIGFGKAAPDHENYAIYLVGTAEGVHGVYRSDDDGTEWTRINDDQHRYGWIGRVITGDPKLYGRVYLGTNGRGIIYGDPR